MIIYKVKTMCIVTIFIILILIPSTQGRLDVHNDPPVNKLQSSSGTYHFYGESNAPIYIITLETASDIVIVGGQSIITGRANGTQTTAGSSYAGCFITDGKTLYIFGGAGSSEGVQIGELRFLHLHLGTLINYTNDFRGYQTYEHNETMFGCSDSYAVLDNITIPSGKWYLIYFGLAFDLDYDDVLYDYKVWLNFSAECENLTISTSEGGKTYGLCYANYDANLVFSRSWTVECMLNGKADFQINDTFLYEFVSHPFTWGASGFWNVKWNTPQGEQSFFAVMLKKKLYCNENNVEGAVYGVGTYGSYSLQTSYFAYDPTDKGLAWTPFFVGLDVKLP